MSHTRAPLFVYGTLRDPAIRAAVLGHADTGNAVTSARLPGWHVVVFPGETYPALVSDPSSSAYGLLIEGLDDGDFIRLDAFEGNQYRREETMVMSGQNAIAVQIYFPATVLSAPTHDWDFDHWTRHYRAAMLATLG